MTHVSPLALGGVLSREQQGAVRDQGGVFRFSESDLTPLGAQPPSHLHICFAKTSPPFQGPSNLGQFPTLGSHWLT